MSSNKERHCVYPHCGKPLPSYAKIPLCEDHKDCIKEGAQKVAGSVVVAAGAVAVVAKDKITPIAKDVAPKVAKAVTVITKKKL